MSTIFKTSSDIVMSQLDIANIQNIKKNIIKNDIIDRNVISNGDKYWPPYLNNFMECICKELSNPTFEFNDIYHKSKLDINKSIVFYLKSKDGEYRKFGIIRKNKKSVKIFFMNPEKYIATIDTPITYFINLIPTEYKNFVKNTCVFSKENSMDFFKEIDGDIVIQKKSLSVISIIPIGDHILTIDNIIRFSYIDDNEQIHFCELVYGIIGNNKIYDYTSNEFYVLKKTNGKVSNFVSFLKYSFLYDALIEKNNSYKLEINKETELKKEIIITINSLEDKKLIKNVNHNYLLYINNCDFIQFNVEENNLHISYNYISHNYFNEVNTYNYELYFNSTELKSFNSNFLRAGMLKTVSVDIDDFVC